MPAPRDMPRPDTTSNRVWGRQSQSKLKVYPVWPADGAPHAPPVEQLLSLAPVHTPSDLLLSRAMVEARLRLEDATGVAQSAVRMRLEGSTVWKSEGTSAVSHAAASDSSRIHATCCWRICTPSRVGTARTAQVCCFRHQECYILRDNLAFLWISSLMLCSCAQC